MATMSTSAGNADQSSYARVANMMCLCEVHVLVCVYKETLVLFYFEYFL